jgi:hypothetical protein
MRAEPLGSLLANRGHITEEQLELALTEQKVTGRPLGEIIVARGFAAAPTVAQALATQHGGLLKTEYGFATGWAGAASEGGAPGLALPEPPRHDETATLRASLDEHQKALEAWKQSHAQLEERLAQAQQPASVEDDSRLAELEAERDALKAELAEAAQKPAPAADDSRVPALEAERDALRGERDALKAELAVAQKPAPVVDDPRIAELEAELAEAQKPVEPVADPRLNQLIADRENLQAELAARDTSIAELKASRAKVESARAELEQALAREVERVALVRAELDELQNVPASEPAPAGRWAGAESHLVFFQGADGYELVERAGPPPSEGSTVDALTVARIAPAPIPGSALPCAYLVS